MREQRRHPRVPVQVTTEISAGDVFVIAETKDLSLGGVSILTDENLVKGRTVFVTLILTQDGIEDPDEEPLESSATVRWTQDRPDGRCLAGMQFGPLTAAQKLQLDRFLSAMSQQAKTGTER